MEQYTPKRPLVGKQEKKAKKEKEGVPGTSQHHSRAHLWVQTLATMYSLANHQIVYVGMIKIC
jgi:hypothetical protein